MAAAILLCGNAIANLARAVHTRPVGADLTDLFSSEGSVLSSRSHVVTSLTGVLWSADRVAPEVRNVMDSRERPR
jgi:hypothetical protein